MVRDVASSRAGDIDGGPTSQTRFGTSEATRDDKVSGSVSCHDKNNCKDPIPVLHYSIFSAIQVDRNPDDRFGSA